MEHPDYAGPLRGGCICAGYMEENIIGARKREDAFKASRKRRVRWLSREWLTSRAGNQYLSVDGFNVVVFPVDDAWGARILDRENRTGSKSAEAPCVTEKDAKLAAFDRHDRQPAHERREAMSDEPEDPPTIIKLVSPSPDPMKERGARMPDPPRPERPPPGDPETAELSTLITQAITIRGAQKKDLVPHWLAVDVMRVIDPNRHAPDLVRRAAMVLLRDLATRTMLAYRPPSDALKLIEQEEAAYVRRLAAEDVAAALARHIPSICALCGKKHEDGASFGDPAIQAAAAGLHDLRHNVDCQRALSPPSRGGIRQGG